MRIAHISDIHIRNLRYLDEYRAAFADLFRQLRELKPDLIVNTGDTAHTKVQISPEFVQMTSEFLTGLGDIAPTLVILGNHDLNLKNADRLDAISPIISNVRSKHPVMLPLESGECHHYFDEDFEKSRDGGTVFRFWLYGITDEDKHPTKLDTFVGCLRCDCIDIGLYHGSVFGAVVDSGFELEHYEASFDRFEGMDFMMLGDIHKRQSFMDGKAWYAGSLIQQNFGEDPDKGFLLWDIRSRDSFDVTFHQVKGSRGFYTVQIDSDLSIPNDSIPPDSRVRAIVDAELSLAQQKDIEREIRKKFQPKDVVSIVSRPKKTMSLTRPGEFDPDEPYADRLEEFVRARGADDRAVSLIKTIDTECSRLSYDEDTVHPHAFWRVNKIAWSNLFNYGSDNLVDMDKANGLVGIFAPNASGKSSIFDVFLEGLFDKISKDVPRNIDLINDNRDTATILVDMTVGNENYLVERQIDRVKYGQKKYSEAKEWGKTTLSLFKVTPEGKIELSENGISRSETERQIRRLIGSFDEFVMTTMISQTPISGVPGGADIINCKETDRKKILFKFLGLDSFETKAEIAKETLKQLTGEMKSLDPQKLADDFTTSEHDLLIAKTDQGQEKQKHLEELVRLNLLNSQLLEAELAQIPDVPEDPDTIKLRIAAIESEIVDLDREMAVNMNLLNCAQTQLFTLKNTWTFDPGVSIEELNLVATRLANDKLLLKEKLKTSLVVLKNAKKASETIDDVPCEGKFPTCKFLLDAFTARSSLDNLQKAYEEIVGQQSSNDSCDEENNKLLVVKKVFLKHLADLNLRESEISLLSERINHTGQLIKAKQEALKSASMTLEASLAAGEQRQIVIEMKSGIEKLKKLITDTMTCVFLLETKISKFERLIGALEQKMTDVTMKIERLEDLQNKVSAYELYVEAMGKHGIPYVILTGMLPLINEEINKILSSRVDFGVYIEHDPYEQTIRIYIQYGEYKSRPLGLGSGAEKFIASLAIRAALLSVSRLPKTSILIVDEGFGRLDPEMLDAVQGMLEYMKTIFGSVFVISHVDAMKDWVDSNIDITVDRDGYAHVEVT